MAILLAESSPPPLLDVHTQFEQQIAQQVSYNATLHRHRRRLHASAGEALRRKLDVEKQIVGNEQSMELSELHESIAGHFWEAIKGRLAEKSEGRVTEAELMGFSTSAIWSTERSMAFAGQGWQVSYRPAYCSYHGDEAISASPRSSIHRSIVSHSSRHPV